MSLKLKDLIIRFYKNKRKQPSVESNSRRKQEKNSSPLKDQPKIRVNEIIDADTSISSNMENNEHTRSTSAAAF